MSSVPATEDILSCDVMRVEKMQLEYRQVQECECHSIGKEFEFAQDEGDQQSRLNGVSGTPSHISLACILFQICLDG